MYIWLYHQTWNYQYDIPYGLVLFATPKWQMVTIIWKKYQHLEYQIYRTTMNNIFKMYALDIVMIDMFVLYIVKH
jgi:hypothetical protein